MIAKNSLSVVMEAMEVTLTVVEMPMRTLVGTATQMATVETPTQTVEMQLLLPLLLEEMERLRLRLLLLLYDLSPSHFFLSNTDNINRQQQLLLEDRNKAKDKVASADSVVGRTARAENREDLFIRGGK